jgi:drug/metabolite transporter (DMT)-like permease
MALLCAVWGLQQVAIKVAVAEVGPITQVGLRSLVATILVFAWARWRGLPLFRRDGSLRSGLLAGTLFALEFVCIYAGLEYTGASRMVVFLYTAPCFTVLGLHWFVSGERIGARHMAGVLLAFAGILAAFAEGLGQGGHWLGDLLGVVAAILWAATTVLIRASTLARLDAAKVLLYQLLVSALLALPLALAVGEPRWTLPSPQVLGALAYQAVVVAFISYLAWFWLLTRFLVTRLTVFSFLTPLFGIAFGVLLLGERMSGWFVLAALMVLAGIVLVNLPERRR